MSETIRTFIAFELPESVISLLAGVQRELKTFRIRARWVRPENIHLTLKFLGNIHCGEVDKIAALMSDTVQGLAPITLSVRGVGVFPGVKRPRVIWVGLGGQIQLLVEMQRMLDENLAAIGFQKENRAFKGHLTLGRVKQAVNPKLISQIIQEYAGLQSEEFSVNQIFLYKSDLNPSGSVYSKLQRVAF